MACPFMTSMKIILCFVVFLFGVTRLLSFKRKNSSQPNQKEEFKNISQCISKEENVVPNGRKIKKKVINKNQTNGRSFN